MARELGDDDVLASSLLGVSLVSSFVGDTEVARVNADEALTLFRARADRWGQATAFVSSHGSSLGADTFAENSQVFEDALVVADELADEVNRAMIETNVAEQRLHLGRYDDAADLDSLAVCADTPSAEGALSNVLCDRATIHASCRRLMATPEQQHPCSAPPTASARSSACQSKDLIARDELGWRSRSAFSTSTKRATTRRWTTDGQ